MPHSYATAKAAYRELRSAIGPWAKANSYRRWADTQAGWQKPVDAGERLLFKFECASFANSDIGNSFHGLVQLEPLSSHGPTILRQASFSCCLVQAELDELARIQGTINRRRPPLPSYLKTDVAANSLLGHDLQAMYDPKPQYQEGNMINFAYYGLQDARELASFVGAVLPQALERFLQGRVTAPVDRTPRHLRSKWFTS